MPNNDDFRKSFASSKKSGAKTFTHQGKSYTTQTASEKAQGMTPKQKLDAYYKSYSNESSYHARTGNYSKSKAEVTRSYQDAAVKDPKAMEMDYKMRLDAYKKEKSYKEGGKMPLKKASGKGKAAVQKAVSANIAELTRANREKPAGKKRSKEQIAAIAYSAARKK